MSNANLSATRPRDCAKGPGKLALHSLTVKYKSYGIPPDNERRPKPSTLVREKLDLPIPYRDGKTRLRPKIIERHNFFNLPYRVPSSVPEHEPLFQPFPPQITFTGYKAFNKYHAILQLRNNDKVVRRVMVLPLVSEILTVQPYSHPDLEKQTVYDELGTSRVACGMEFSVIVNWCPEDDNDFQSEVVVVTEREKFIVPVVCHGLRGVLDIADEIHFPPTPVHYSHKKNVMLKNPGTRNVSFRLRTFVELEDGREVSGTFFVEPKEGNLEPGQFLELCLEFKPTRVGIYDAMLEVRYLNTSELVYSRLNGTGVELDVGLSTDKLTMKPTFIRTSSELSIFFTNYSTEVATFQFERYATQEEEVEYQQGQKVQGVKALDWAKQIANTFDPLEHDEDNDASSQEKIFTLNPASGELWPGNRLEVIATFSPQRARRYFTIAYCTVSGKQDRLELRLDGLGVGPLAQFFPTKVDLKELSLYSEYNFDVNLHNTGGLEALFELETSRSANPGTIFRFDPESGSIPVGEIQKIRVTLFCNERCKFEEHFKWVIRDSVNFAPILFRGRVGNPSVIVEPLALDFGLVSYGFDCFREFRITNNSNVPLHLKLTLDELEVYMICPIHGPMKRIKIPHDCDQHAKESYFVITPALTTVPAKETNVIVVTFTPFQEREYEGFITVHLEEISEDICKVTFEADCKTAKVTLPVDFLNYEKTYLRYEYSKSLELLNESQVPAKYKLVPLEYEALQLGNAFSRPREGIIEAFSVVAVDILFVPYALGPIEFSLLISICGKDPVNLTVKIKAEGIGAQLNFVVFSDKEIKSSGENPVVDFGTIKVLQEHYADIEITNISLIPAVFRIVQENTQTSAFRICLDQATLQPREQLNLTVRAFVDETLKFKDMIKITLEGGMYKIPCFARGFGSLLVCKEFDTGAIHFGDALTYSVLSSTISVQNLGRRPRHVIWTVSDPKSGRKVFCVNPHKTELISKASGSFLLSGTSPVAARVEELVTCTGTVAAPSAKPIDEPEAHSIFVNADIAHLALVFTPVSLNFVQMNGPGHEELDESLQTLTCQNMFKLELHGSLEVQLPFRLSRTDFCLQPMESMEVDVILDWQRPKDKLTHYFADKMVVHYRDTPRKDYVPLAAEVHFPNLQIDANKIEFGCVIENTSKRVQLKISNISILEVHYSWAFIDKYGIDINTTSASLQENEGYKIPTNQIFDILPIRGILLPGETETVEFSYFSFPKYKCRALALCEVDGGPSYSVVLDAESSAVKYKINRYLLDFGVQHFLHPVTSRMLSLTNESGVPFNFELDVSDVKREGMLRIDPMTGHALSTQTQKFKLTAHAGIPDKFVEHFKLQVEYFHPHELEVRVEGMYPNITLDIQRVRSDKFLSLVETAWTHIYDSKVKGLTYPMKDSSEDSITEAIPPKLPEMRSKIQRHPSACVMTPPTVPSEQSNDDDAQGRPVSPSNVGEDGGVSSNQKTPPEKTPEQLGQEKAEKEAAEAARIHEELKPTMEEVDVEIDRMMVLEHFYEPIPVETQPDALQEDNPEPIGPPSQSVSPRKNEAKALKANGGQKVEAEVGIESAKLKVAKTKVDDVEAKAGTQKTDVNEVPSQPLPSPVQMREKHDVDIQKIVANKYVLDFDNVRLGFAKKLTIRVTTGGYLPVTFKVDKSKAKGYGFSIEPDRVVKLPAGHSVPQTAELDITFNTNAPKFPVGRLECWVPINIKEGPITMLLLTANVIAPDLHLSTNTFDFETVIVGRCKSMFLRMENRGEAPCDWHSERPEPGTVTMRVLKDWDFFKCIPDYGTIPPHDMMLVKVRFAPKLQKLKSSYETILPLRVSGVPTPYIINLKGRGYLVPITFVPSFVDIGPIIPNSDVPAQARVQLKNRSNQSIEVYTLDFDPQYIQEEEILRDAKGYDENQLLYLDVREAGDPFWKGVVEEAPSSPKGAGKGGKTSKESNAKSEKGQEKKKDDKDNKKGKASTQGKPVMNGPIVIIYGPPLIGKTTQAKMISHNFKTPIVDVESLMLAAAREKKLVIPGFETSSAEGGKTDFKVRKPAGKKEDPQKDVKKGKGNPQAAQKGGKKEQPVKRNFEADLMNVLKTRLQNADCNAGVVFDGLRSVYVPVLTLVKCILEVLGLKSSVVNVPISEDESVSDKEVLNEGPKQKTLTKPATPRNEVQDAKDKSGAKGTKKTVPKNIWKGGPQVNFLLLRVDPLELATHYEKVSEICHSALKSKPAEEEDADIPTPPRICQHHLHFPALEGGEKYRNEVASHVHLDSPSHYPYISVFPTPEEVERFFLTEIELMKILGEPTTKEEAEKVGQNVILTTINAMQEVSSILIQAMAILPVSASKLPVQEPIVQQIIRKPPVRELLDVTDFTYSIMTALPGTTPGSPKGGDKKGKVAPKEKKDDKTAEKGAGSKKAEASGKMPPTKSPLDIVPPGHEKKTRWVIPPKTSVGLAIQFWSSKTGEFDHAFEFEVMGTSGHHATLDCTGIVAYPQITLYYMKFPPRRQNPNLIGVKEKRTPTLIPLVGAGLDFGPINTAIPPKEYPDLPDGEHCKKLSVKNTGLFDLHVDFELIMIAEDTSPGSPPVPAGKTEQEKPLSKKSQETEKKPGKGDKKGAKKGNAIHEVYTVHPAALDLLIDQSLVLSVFCYPKEGLAGKVSAKLLCKIKNCPDPLEYIVTSIVDTPRLELSSNVIDFQRVLLGKKGQEDLIIRNVSVLKLHWNVVGIEEMRTTFSLSETSGELRAGENGTISVAFNAAAEEKLEQKLSLQVTRHKEDTVVAQAHPLRFLAEGYVMDVTISFPQPEPVDGIDFGTIKAAEAAMRTILMENKGKYPVQYRFNLSGQLIKKLFIIPTLEGTLAPKGKLKVDVHFNKEKKLQEETTLQRNCDVTLHLIEPLYERTEKIIPIYISLHAVHTHFLILPAREIDFEYQVCGLLSEARTMKILNTGVLELEFSLSAAPVKDSDVVQNNKEASLATKKSTKTVASAKTTAGSKTSASGKGGQGKKGQAAAAPKMLDLRGFQLFPSVGKVAPGMKQDISVYFKAPETPTKVYEEILIAIKDKDPVKYPEDISYDLKGESQFPGFRTDPEVIFEEHRIVDNLQLSDTVLPPRTYSKGDHMFSFGAVYVDTDPPPTESELGPGKPSVKFSGEIHAVKVVGKTRRKGADVNFKFDNPYKVPCTVEFTLTPEGVEQETLEAYETPFAMEIQPMTIDIPPLECRYIQCLFTPASIRTYAAIFEAVVKNGGDDVRTKQFKCHLKGEGTLPHVHLETPTDISPSGAPWLQYPRIKINQSFTLPIILHNSGIVSATANILVGGGCDRWLQMTLQTDQMLYNVLPFNSSFKVRSTKRETILVTFTPLEIRNYECEIQIAVSSNPFNNLRILLSGEGYLEAVECLGLPRQLSDTIWFEDGPYGVSKTIPFTLRNNSDRDWRFTWPSIPSVEFSPATGHLHASSTKAITAVFNPTEMTEYIDKDIRVPMYNILFQEPRPLSQWDSPIPDIAMLEADLAALAKEQSKVKGAQKKGDPKGTKAEPGAKQDGAKAGSEKARKVKTGNKEPQPPPQTIVDLDLEPEPHHEVVPDSNKTMVLKLHAVADMIRYECSANSIHFKSTMMFQARTFSFSLKSLSRANLVFNWQVYMQDGQPEPGSLYAVSPHTGSLTAGNSITISVKFSPSEVEDCTRILKCEIPGLDPQWMPLSLPVTGHVTRPWCHFKLPKSDYISGKRRSQALNGPDGEAGPLHPDMKVIEIKSLGINVQTFMTFTAVNPTSLVYKFVWEAISTPSHTWPEDEPLMQYALEKLEEPFRCLSQEGEINPGEGYEMNFEFCPLRYELQERFWTFRIPALDIAVPFLLVGFVDKPKLHFDHAVVNFGKVQVGTKGESRILLVNCEDIPFPFSFDKTTYLRTQCEQNPLDPVLLFLPPHGTVSANSETPVDIRFMPTGEGSQNFNVVCNLKKSLQLTVNVKGEGYTIHDKVFLEVLNDGIPLQLSPKEVSRIDFGEILVNNKVFKRFQLTNTGIFPLQFVWLLGGHKEVVVEPPGGTVGSEEQLFCDMSFCPSSPATISNIMVTCQIRHSNSYVLNLCGTAYRPKAVFSFLDYDFGPTFLDAPERDPPFVELVIKNAGMSAITVESLYESTPQLDVPHATLLIPGGEKDSVFITFKPQATRVYKEHVQFSINGLDTVTVLITGEGVGLDIQLKDPTQKNIIFDSLKIGQFAKIPVHLINRSKAPCQLSWAPLQARFLELDMVCLPAEGLLLKAKASGTMDIQFRPKSRIAPFNEPFIIAAANTETILATVSGACTGTEVKLSVNKLAFATVTLGSSLKRKIQVENCGDIGTAFAWDVCTHATECTFFPPDGYLAPHQVATVEVSFHPTAVHPDILIDRIPCVITGGETQFLSITGACIEHDPPVETFSFIAPVRSTDAKTLQIKNPTERLWLLTPKIVNKSFKGHCTVEVPPKGTVGYSIIFCPLTMSNGIPHTGSITLPMPDGSALYYNLSGDAGAPLPAGDISFDVMARRKSSFPLQVENWLNLPQIFEVIIQQHVEDPIATLTGPKAVEIPGGAGRECLLHFHAYRPGTYGYKVTFLNEKTGEYIFYNLMAVVNKGDIVKTIPFECVLRQRMVHILHIKNPLQAPVTFTVKCENPEIKVPATIEIEPAAMAAIDIAYRPLLEVQKISYLILTNQLLGEMVYQLDLVCHAAGFDDTLHFTVPLGSRQTQVFRFMHYLAAKINYKCELSEEGKEAGFIVPPTAIADSADLDGKEAQVSVIFEPSVVGEKSSGILYIQDPKAGTYTCRLLGTCVPPVPQGPVILYGKAGSINFRNVFDRAIQFVYATDNPAFVCSKGEKITPKKQIKVSVSYKPSPGLSDRGRLTISSPDIPLYSWVFYLQGTNEPARKAGKDGKGARKPSPTKDKTLAKQK